LQFTAPVEQAVADHEMVTGIAAVVACAPWAGRPTGAVTDGRVRVLTLNSYTVGELVLPLAGSVAVNLNV
jgi:hypothetical protein